MLELLRDLGYVDTDPEVCAFVGNHFATLNQGALLVEDRLMELKLVFMDDEERKKQEILIANRKQMREKIRQEQAYKKQLSELSMKERHAKAQEPVKASHGNQLKFGANVVKFEPPKEQRGG